MGTSPHTRRLDHRVARTAARFVSRARDTDADVTDLVAMKLPWFEVRAQGSPGAGQDAATVFIFDEIGGSFGISAKDLVAQLEEIDAPTIAVRINSPGGSVFDAIAIYNALNHHPARIQVFVDSLAASAASVIAMAGDEIVMMPGSQMMIHDASAVQDGNAAEMSKMATFLDRQSANIAEIYSLRAGGDLSGWRDLMLAETWMFAREAVDMGLADRVEAPPARPETEVLERAHDLSGFRYAGRRSAPPPGQRPAGERRVRTAGEPATQVSGSVERDGAAQRRASAAAGRPALARRSAPAGVSGARMAAFPATLRAELVERDGQQRYHVVGHASVVDRPYEMWDSHGPYKEVVEAGAFTRTLATNPDVAFLVNHRGVTMARTTNGSLVLSMDSVGLKVEAWLNPKRQDVSDLVTAIQDRDVTEMSFAFMLLEGGGTWSADFTTFSIRDLDLDRGDVSAVNYGANPYTDVAARSREVLADLDHLPRGAARTALDRLRSRLDGDAPGPTAAACPECGCSVPDGAQFCPQCGEPMTGEAADVARPEPVAAGSVAAAAQQLDNGGRKISFVEALLDI